jgi:hypothetical protein
VGHIGQVYVAKVVRTGRVLPSFVVAEQGQGQREGGLVPLLEYTVGCQEKAPIRLSVP